MGPVPPPGCIDLVYGGSPLAARRTGDREVEKHPLFDLSGRVALVTGAGSGIGRACCEVLASLGAHVACTDVEGGSAAETAAKLSGEGHFAARHDVTDADAWRAVCGELRARHDRLDVLVNNAGIMLARRFEEAPVEDLRQQYRINVEGPFLGMQACLPLLKQTAARHGAKPSIINVSSVYGEVAGDRYAAYSASKAAIAMLSRAVGHELAPSGIRVNAVLPGPCATNLGAKHEPMRGADGAPLSLEQTLAYWLGRMPIGRMGVAHDIAPVVAFLACDASIFLTGAQLVADGGYSAF
jgi:NAD(P)-dependent dehydrogenase (short-subunit alcohol dehydrogenase family)